MRYWLMLQVDVLGCEFDGVFIHHHEEVQVFVGFASMIASTWLSFDMHLLSNVLVNSLSKLLRGDLYLVTAGFDKQRPLLRGILLVVNVSVRITALLGVLRGLEIIPLISHVGRVQEAWRHGLRFLDALGVAGGCHLFVEYKDLLHRACRVLHLLSLRGIFSRSFGI
jgi:hypothetical protein